MRSYLAWLLVSVVAGPVTMTSGAVRQEVRDAGTPPTMGTASISGVVVDDEQPAQPVRRAVVTLTGSGLHPDRGAITDDLGRFTLRDLPAGRFRLTAERGAYVTSVYGAKRPGRPGTLITVADGQQVANLRVRLWRGAVVSGVVRDESGDPVPDVEVSAVPAREVTPAALTLSNSSQATTNDLGEFRIFGLEPGTYVVRAGTMTMGISVAQVARSEADIDATLAALAARAGRPGAMPAVGAAAKPAEAIPAGGTTVRSAPIYFPGTPVVADATPITLKAGEERSGLDFAVRPVRTADIHGTVAGPDGQPVPRAFVQLAIGGKPTEFAGASPAPLTATSGADGSIALTAVPPGDYRLLVRGLMAPASGAGGGVASSPIGWAVAPVSVNGADIDLGTLTLRPGMMLSGHVALETGATSPRPDLSSLRVEMQSDWLAVGTAQGRGGVVNMRYLRPATVGADGTFAVTDLVPDDYELTVSGVGLGPSGWWLRSAMWNGRDLLDAPVRIAQGQDVSGVTLVLSDRRTELSGTLVTPAGAAVSDVFVLVYPADAALRLPHARRIAAVRPDSSGRYIFRNLPAGDYLLCALRDVDEGEWNDPGFFDPLVPASLKITLADGEQKVQDLRLGTGS
jgi:Carboxypeptidase regulatory-like domain